MKPSFTNTMHPWEDVSRPKIWRWMDLAQCWVKATRRWRDNPHIQEFEDEHFYYVTMAKLICEVCGFDFKALYDFWEYMSARPKERDVVFQKQAADDFALVRIQQGDDRSSRC